jgi:hypothetical protein
MEIKPFSFVAPASRMPESAERTVVLHLFTTWPSLQAAATPDFVHTYLAGQPGRVFRNTNPIYFVVSNFRRENLDLPRTTGLQPDFLALHQ